MTSEHVDLDPVLAADLSVVERLAAQVHVLRARADALRGPRRGERALMLAMRASSLEEEVLTELGVDRGARVMSHMEDHPATRAAIDRWLYALRLTYIIMDDEGGAADQGPATAGPSIPEQPA